MCVRACGCACACVCLWSGTRSAYLCNFVRILCRTLTADVGLKETNRWLTLCDNVSHWSRYGFLTETSTVVLTWFIKTNLPVEMFELCDFKVELTSLSTY